MTDRHVYATESAALPGTFDNEYPNLDAAWTAASNDDAIYIHSGTYSGSGTNVHLTLQTKTGISINGFAGDTMPILDVKSAADTAFVTKVGVVFDGLHLRDPNFYCIRLDTGSYGVEFLNGILEIAGGVEGMLGNHNSVDNIKLSGSTVYQKNDQSAPANNTYGIRSIGTGDVGWFVEGNEFYGLKYHISAGASSSFTMTQNLHRNDEAARNNTVYAINWKVTAGTSIAKNSVFDEMGRGIDFGSGNDGFLSASNNTFFNNQYGIACWGRYLGEIKNNIFLANDTAIVGDSGGDQPAPDTNCLFDNLSDVVDYTADINSVTDDPGLIDALGGNYSIDDTSPCFDAGLTLSYITDDYVALARPQGAGYDIGAYEVFVPIVQFQSFASSSLSGSAFPGYIIRSMGEANNDRQKRRRTAEDAVDQLDQVPFAYTVPGPFGLRGRSASYKVTQ